MGQSLRIVSGNLLNGRANMDLLLERISDLEVDVFACQEVSPGQVDCLSELLPYGEIVPHHNYVGMALMSRRPVSIERIPLSWAFGQTACLHASDWPELGASLEITNLHVAAPHLYRPAPGLYLRWRQLREFFDYLERADARAAGDDLHLARAAKKAELSQEQLSQEQLLQKQLLQEQLLQEQPMQEQSAAARSAPAVPARVLVGDFNSTPYWPWYRRIASQFTDAAVTVAEAKGGALRSTWGPWPDGPKLFRIDHGFVRGVEVEDFRVFEIEGSDHSALAMDVSLPSNSGFDSP